MLQTGVSSTRGFTPGQLTMRRLANTAFVDMAFAFTKRIVRCDGFQLPLRRRKSTVIGSEDDDRAIRNSEFPNVSQDTADAFIHALDHGRVDRIVLQLAGLQLRAILPYEFFFRLDRDVDGIMRQVKKERPRAIRANELDCFVGQTIRQIFTFGPFDRWIALPLRVEEALWHSAVRPADVHIEALFLGPVFGCWPEMPFADMRRNVSKRFQHLGDRGFFQSRETASAPEAGALNTGSGCLPGK